MLQQLQQRLGERVKENEPLVGYTTYHLGGPADYFFSAKTSDEVIAAVQVAQELSLPFFVLGGGSNVLISDDGFRGLIIKMDNRGLEIRGNEVLVEAGAPTAAAAFRSVEAGLTGFEWAIGLPGTIGGAIRGNAGMAGGETGQVVAIVRCLHAGAVEELTREQCEFAYRSSIFKKQRERIILSATLTLKFGGDVTAGREKLKEILLRKKTQQPLEHPSAGCVFKNWRPSDPQELNDLHRWFDLGATEQVPLTADGCVPAGWIIDHAQLKSTTIGGISISNQHANFFLNADHGRAQDVIELIALTKTRVRNLSHGIISLQEEIEYVGF